MLRDFTLLFPSIITGITIVACMYALSMVMKNIPMGITYASFAGLTIIATVVVGIFRFDQMPNLYSIIGLAFIIVGVLMVNLLGKLNMKPLLGYLFLAVGISFGIASNSFAKISDGFTKVTPSILCIVFMCITMFSISKAMSALPVGFAYSTYSGLTVTGVVLFAMLKYNQIPNIYGTIGIILIIIGVVMVNYLGRLN
ncbi:MAG: DMT family transporter [Candidatus Pelagibacter sp.]